MTHASVFSGIGGPEVAASMLGWENLFHCEINPFGKQVLDYWYPNSKSYEDITTTDFTEWRGRVDVLTGGFPCQPFSYAGQRRGADDDRYLWPSMYRCIDEVRPTWVVAENVTGIITMVEQGEVSSLAGEASLFDTYNDVQRYELRETFTMQRICDDLEGHGYAVQPILVPACGVGAPHRRDRVFFVAYRLDADSNSMGRGTRRSKERGGQEDGVSASLFCDTKGYGCCDDVAYTDGERLERPASMRVQGHEGRGEYDGLRQCSGHCGKSISVRGWNDFPTVSPVHRGNDGLPFDVDCLTISFGQWRTESLKAYGNAIVPAVMYEIFRAIEEVEHINTTP